MSLTDIVKRNTNKNNDLMRDPGGYTSDFDRIFNDLVGNVWGLGNWANGGSSQFLSPQLDISEDEKVYTISADLPGISEKDIDVSVEDDLLYIKAERKMEPEDKDEKRNYHRIERSYGSFQRALRLPEDVDRDQIKATYKNGELSIKLQKRPDAKPERRRIEVK